ncbi:hypothetical protein OPHB3_1951 [Oceanobacillus picturae]|uniref:Phage ABA sandwich domain-containing protein n=1 Tax=Oceanobacillus picturae TaxID=171693 RepID=A0A0U9HGB2_9BACI|nr:hypothetical protein [Oceanobacillus picturae]GAQ18012.1 hypothetical protein OPHB3_1951 [Oceanobacillus picturae]
MNNRQIDQLVAEKVMGWRLKNMSAGNYWVGEHDGLEGDWTLKQLWKPSERIDHAWEVVEKLHMTVTPQCGAPEEMNCHAEVDNQPFGNYYEAFAKTAPLAICLAALKTVGVEVKQ